MKTYEVTLHVACYHYFPVRAHSKEEAEKLALETYSKWSHLGTSSYAPPAVYEVEEKEA